MKVYRDLLIQGAPDALTTLGERITEVAAREGWARDRDAERGLRRDTDGRDVYYFRAEASQHHPAVTVVLGIDAEGQLKVFSAFPLKSNRFSEDQYNGIIERFATHVLQPAAEGLAVTVNLGSTSAGLDKWLSLELARRLESFSSLAEGTVPTHPSDRERWERFLIAAHIAGTTMTASDLRQWLIEDQRWPAETAEDLAIDYERARSLLDRYDQQRSR